MPLPGLFLYRSTTRTTCSSDVSLDPEQTSAIATAIDAAGMAAPASVALRIMKPVSWIGGQLLWVLQPLLGTLGMRRAQNPISLPGIASLLEREDAVDDLIARLDTPSERRI